MKYFIIISLSLFIFQVQAQKIANFNNLEGSYMGKKYEMYITKSKDTLQIGDTLIIGKMSSDKNFLFIAQGNQFAGSQISGHEAIISDFLVVKRGKSRPAVMWVNFGGWGMVPVSISYEQALEAGEVINPNSNTYTKEQAIEELKKAKELLTLELINQAEYDSIKNELSPFIMGE